MSLARNQTGFTALEGLLIAVIVGIIGLAGYFVWHSQKQTNDTLSDTNKVQNAPTPPKADAEPSDYEKCRTAEGSRMLETYPAQCVTKDGKTYVSPEVSAVAPAQDHQYLTIKEWGVKVALTYAQKLNYTYDSADSPAGGYVDVSTDSSVSLSFNPVVSTAPECQQLDLKWSRSTEKSNTVQPVSHVGKYYYYTWGDGAPKDCSAEIQQMLTRTTAEQMSNPFVEL